MTNKSPKIGLGGVLGGLWRLLAANTEQGGWDSVFWEPLGALLAASWGGLGGLLGPSWPSWRPLGPVLAAKIGAQVNQKSTQKSITILIDVGIDFWEDFGGFYLPKTT